MPQNAAPPRSDKRKPQAAGTGLKSRLAAYEILKLVASGRYLDEAMRKASGLEPRDRAFARMLVTTCLRRSGQIDAVLGIAMSKPPAGRARDAKHVMRMGVAQLLFMDTGAHAAVDSTVSLMRAAGFERMTGLANAVMRRLSREGAALLEDTDVGQNCPGWMLESWKAHWGEERTAATMELAMTPPPLDITPRADTAGWAQRLDGQLIDGRTVRRGFDGDPTALNGFSDGAWWVQDAAAALPAALFGDLKGRHVVDLCAAPGGKTAQLIAAGADVTAVDNSKPRLDILKRNLDRLGMTADLVRADGRTFRPRKAVDAVLIDAPCSATGTLRRRPDVLHHRAVADLAGLAAIQRELLARAASWLSPGGRLIYATCSLQHEEGEAVVADVTGAMKGKLAIDPVSTAEAGSFAPALTGDGCLRILPSDFTDIGGVDGFFIARLQSVSP